VIVESINWFEEHFFNSETINGPIATTFIINYIFLILTLGILIGIVFTLISYTAKYFALEEKREKPVKKKKKFDFEKFKQGIKIGKIVIYAGAFIINWVLFERFFGLEGIFYASLIITLIYLTVILVRRYRILMKREEKTKFKEFIISRIQLKHLFYSLFITIYFLVILIIFLISYPSPSLPSSPFLDGAFVVILLILISSIVLSISFGFILFYLDRKEQIRLEFKLNLKNIRIQNKRFVRVYLYSIVCTLYFIFIYLIFSYSYPFAFMWPSNYIDLVLTVVALPILFSMELLYRKLIYPNLTFLSENARRKVIIIIAVVIQITLMLLTSSWSFFPSVLFTYFMFLYVVIQNTLIFEHTHNFAALILSSFNIIQIFFSAVISNALGIGSALSSFVKF